MRWCVARAGPRPGPGWDGSRTWTGAGSRWWRCAGRAGAAEIGRGTALVAVYDFDGLFALFNAAADRAEPVDGEI
ncbi:hypothetical protein [Allokutzneria oryzae]|uniref:Uncharacterized protein n=1 Tax=Allokutzneria oryzae TaxID=1378989 RepID=A0ABV6A735_9PSEU